MAYAKGYDLNALIEAFDKFDGSLRVIVETPNDWSPPNGFASYRGDYSKLMIDYKGRTDVTVDEFRKQLRSALGGTFQGWKGGDYVMDGDTPIYIDRAGEANRVIVSGVRENGDTVEIHGLQLAEWMFW